MRVVAGIYKGRRLSAPTGRVTRPTADRVREAVFNLLGPLAGERVLDLYAGSGALGIEALSRGASSATFVDSAPHAVKTIRDNLELLGTDEAQVTRTDAVAFLRSAARRGQRWDLVFCDPPYRLAHRLGRDLATYLPRVLGEHGRIVCESSSRQPLRLDLPLLTERRYGDTAIVVHRAPAAPGDG